MARDRQPVSLPRRHRKYIGVVRKEHVESPGLEQLVRVHQVWLAESLVIHSGEVQVRVTEGEARCRAPKESNAQARALFFGIVFRPGIDFMIPQATENARVRPQLRKVRQTCI